VREGAHGETRELAAWQTRLGAALGRWLRLGIEQEGGGWLPASAPELLNAAPWIQDAPYPTLLREVARVRGLRDLRMSRDREQRFLKRCALLERVGYAGFTGRAAVAAAILDHVDPDGPDHEIGWIAHIPSGRRRWIADERIIAGQLTPHGMRQRRQTGKSRKREPWIEEPPLTLGGFAVVIGREARRQRQAMRERSLV
jgi:hypothetical protein